MNLISEIKLLIVEDHILLREGIVSLFKTHPDFEVVGEAGTVAEAISLSRELRPNLILMDYGLPDGTGLEATQAILANNPDTNIIFLTVHESEDDLFAAIRSGAKGYLLKNIPVAKMIDAIKGMIRGEAPISREMTTYILAEFARDYHQEQGKVQAEQIFTPRELEVLAEIATGASNKEIAENLFVSVNTVKNHIHNMLGKLDLKNRRELVKYAEQHGLTGATQK